MHHAPILDVEHLTLRHGNRELVHCLSLRVPPGRFLAIMGPNGAGKSSLLRGILGLLPIAAGKIQIGGQQLETLAPEQRARSVAYVPQHSALNLDWSVQEVVRMGRFAHRHAPCHCTSHDNTVVERSMLQTDVLHLARRNFATLSGGERSRVLIARALATEAPLLLLDEPTQCLDPAHAIECLSQLWELRETMKTIVMVTHDLNQITYLADEILLMQAGRRIALGPPKDLFRNRDIDGVFGVRLIAESAFGYAQLDRLDEANCA